MMGFCRFPGGIHECIEKNGTKICGDCNYFVPEDDLYYAKNPDFLEVL